MGLFVEIIGEEALDWRAKYLIRVGTFYHHFVDRAAPIVSRLFGQINQASMNNEYVTR